MNLIKNIGFVDQVVRALLLLDIIVAYAIGFLSSLTAVFAFIVAAALFGSCLFGHCPLYRFLGFNTRQAHEERHR